MANYVSYQIRNRENLHLFILFYFRMEALLDFECQVQGITVKFKYRDVIGSGSKGTLIAGSDKQEKQYVARMIDMKGFNPETFKKKCQELASVPPHDLLVRVLDVLDQGDSCYIITDKAIGKPLLEYLENSTDDDHFGLFYDLINAFHYLHSEGQIHGNFSPSDAFVSPDTAPTDSTRVQVSDYGLVYALYASSTKSKMGTEFINMQAMTTCIPPEVFKASINTEAPGQRWRKFESDIFSLGRVLKEIMSKGRFRNAGNLQDILIKNVLNCQSNRNLLEH